MWNDLSAYLCGCVDPVDESPRHVHLTREYDDDRADATSREIWPPSGRQVAPAPDDSSASLNSDVRSPRPAFVRQKSIAAARVPPIPSSTPAARRCRRRRRLLSPPTCPTWRSCGPTAGASSARCGSASSGPRGSW